MPTRELLGNRPPPGRSRRAALVQPARRSNMPGKLPMSSLTEAIVETITQPLLVLDGELRVKAANRAFLQHFGVEPAETLVCLVYDLGNGQWNIPGLRRLLEEVLSQNGQVVDYRVEHDFESPSVSASCCSNAARKHDRHHPPRHHRHHRARAPAFRVEGQRSLPKR